jgi:hypothetical protein
MGHADGVPLRFNIILTTEGGRGERRAEFSRETFSFRHLAVKNVRYS